VGIIFIAALSEKGRKAMNNLHKAIYQIVNSQELMAQILEDSQMLGQRFGLAAEESKVLLNLIQDRGAMDGLLAADTLQEAIAGDWQAIWVPPTYAN
jgi:hypothetical protein